MNNRIYFGELFIIREGIDTIPKLYHIHKVTPYISRWKVGDKKSSFDIEKRDSTNPSKKVREKIFEELRNLEFNDYPSRDQCLFAIRESEIDGWMECFANRSEYYQILEIELINGKFIILDETFYDYDDNKFEYKSDMILARHYWEADISEGHTKPVFLFEGNFQVKKIVKEKSHELLYNK